MTPLQAATLALYAAAAIAAVALTRRDPRHRPVAWYLCAVVALDGGRWVRALLLEPSPGPRVGWDLVLRHAEVGLYLASILALPALAVVVFGHDAGRADSRARRERIPRDLRAVGPGAWLQDPRSLGGAVVRGAGAEQAADDRHRGAAARPGRYQGAAAILIAWLGLWSYLIADYPALSGAGLMRIYELVEVGAVLFSGLCFARWLSGPRLLKEGLSPAVACTLALISGPAATVAAPWLTRGTTLETWPGIVAANAVAVGIALVLQLHWLLRGRRRLCSG